MERLAEVNGKFPTNDSKGIMGLPEPVDLNSVEASIVTNLTWKMIYNNFLCNDDKNHIDALINTFVFLGNIMPTGKREGPPLSVQRQESRDSD